jgi:hypothetical protein
MLLRPQAPQEALQEQQQKYSSTGCTSSNSKQLQLQVLPLQLACIKRQVGFLATHLPLWVCQLTSGTMAAATTSSHLAVVVHAASAVVAVHLPV